ncbi:MAG TPA: 4Fe-4S double cluster binding domain-containing protein [Smithellaceae bacterium]|nr:4Fe-4S double cluster binding domain-containing protein [Smithellaceae bacterium]
MNGELKDAVINYLGHRVSAVGFAPVERFSDAPPRHHPSDVCKDARTVVVFGIPIPKGVFTSPAYNLHAVHRSYHTVYRHLDEISLALSNFIESQGPYRAVMIPTYAPMVFQNFEPWGLLSLKHAAVQAGLGAFGRSGQMYHPLYGARLRLSAVVTSAEMPGNPVVNADPCPEKCRACLTVCPVAAFAQDGSFKKMTCLSRSVKHAIYPLALKDAEGLKHIERVINTAGHDYWLDCDECMKVCPNNH